MSHKTSVQTKLDNKQYILKALDDLGYKYIVAKDGEQLKTKGIYGVHENVDILITEVNGKDIKKAIGFAKQSDGTYITTGDFYGTGTSSETLRNKTTTSAKKLETNDYLMQLGFTLDNTTENDTELELEFTRWV